MDNVTEFREKQNHSFDYFTKLTSTGIEPNYKNIEEFAEKYFKFRIEQEMVKAVESKNKAMENSKKYHSDCQNTYINGYIDGRIELIQELYYENRY